jgi:hypothetical protein
MYVLTHVSKEMLADLNLKPAKRGCPNLFLHSAHACCSQVKRFRNGGPTRGKSSPLTAKDDAE